MASLKDAQQLTKKLEELVGQLNEELQNGNVDFEKLVAISDEISERADGIAETFTNVNETLMERIQQTGSNVVGGARRAAGRAASKAGSGGGENG